MSIPQHYHAMHRYDIMDWICLLDEWCLDEGLILILTSQCCCWQSTHRYLEIEDKKLQCIQYLGGLHPPRKYVYTLWMNKSSFLGTIFGEMPGSYPRYWMIKKNISIKIYV